MRTLMRLSESLQLRIEGIGFEALTQHALPRLLAQSNYLIGFNSLPNFFFAAGPAHVYAFDSCVHT